VGKRTVSLVLGPGGLPTSASSAGLKRTTIGYARLPARQWALSKSLDTVQNTIARFQLAAYSPDVTIDISRDACSFYEFHRAEEMIQLGWSRAEAVLGSGSAK